MNGDVPDDLSLNAKDRSPKQGGVISRAGFERLEDSDTHSASGGETGDGIAGTSSRDVNGSTGGGSDQDVGLWGSNGLLATPYVKLLLFLGFVVQVRTGGKEDHFFHLKTQPISHCNPRC